jgi:hypothetical protein
MIPTVSLRMMTTIIIICAHPPIRTVDRLRLPVVGGPGIRAEAANINPRGRRGGIKRREVGRAILLLLLQDGKRNSPCPLGEDHL